MIFCHRTKGAAGCSSYIALAQQVKGELSSSTPCTIRACHIDQQVECPMWGIDIATKLFQQAYCKITAPVIGLSHFGDACLGTSQSGSRSSLNHRADVGVTGVKHIGDRLKQLRSCHKITYAPAGHGIGFGEGIDADNAAQIKLVMCQQRAGTDMDTLEKNFIIALI